MASLDNVLASIPGMGGYLAKKQMNEQADTRDLAQQISLAQLATSLQGQRRTQAADQKNEAFQAEIAALPPEARTRENVLPIMLKYGMVKEALPAMADMAKPKPQGQPIGSGGLRLDSGEIVPPAARPGQPDQAVTPVTVMQDGKKVIIDGRTGKVLGVAPPDKPEKPEKPDAVTPVQIVRDGKVIVVDGRTGKVIGDAPKETPAQQRAVKLRGIGDALQEAEDILSGVKRDAQGNPIRGALPTQSGLGSAVDAVAGFFGGTPDGAAEAQRLKVVAGVLVSKVPRMEGPQSNLDVELYKQMAGDAGNDKMPIARRLAAVQQMKQLYAKYEHLQGDAPGGGGGGGAPQYREGQTATGPGGQKVIFRNGQWVPHSPPASR